MPNINVGSTSHLKQYPGAYHRGFAQALDLLAGHAKDQGGFETMASIAAAGAVAGHFGFNASDREILDFVRSHAPAGVWQEL